MGRGELTIQARTANDVLPVQNVKITITDSKENVLYNLRTDESGDTDTVSLDAVDKSHSLDPNDENPKYSAYGLTAEADGFDTIHIADVQIYDGELAVQPLHMLPKLGGLDRVQNFYFGPPAIELDQQSSPDGPITMSGSMGRIMPNVIIPNPITVRLGTPTSGRNVQVPWLHYVKNVASSEIYSTWPAAALEANIHAILTYALNRVFTQWWRSRGHNFDITNNQQFDQVFVYGRTTFASINAAVDRIFNQYVRRAGQIAPFFTTYCAGRTGACAHGGMRQWGTVTLANQGRTPIEILRTYYPRDIEIITTNIITNIVESFPGTLLRLGSTGNAVERMQVMLNRIRRNFPAIPLITDPPGTFGPSTNAAVREFQRINRLSVDGIIGPITWNRVVQIWVGVTNLAGLNSEGTALGIGTVPPNVTLRTGARGVDVIILQYILDFIAAFFPNLPTLAQDGIFGPQTEHAVREFQRMMGLPVDGVVGSATWRALYNTYWDIRNGVTIPALPDPDFIEHVVVSGDTLWRLAQHYGTTVDAIRALNNLTSDTLMIGQVLRIPNTDDGGDTTYPPGFHYTVQAGDTLWLLSQRFGTTVDAIKQLNGLTSDALHIGQVLRIPSANAVTYTVQSGDTLWLLSQRFGTTVDRLMELNSLTSTVLNIGQVLRIPQE